MDSWHSKLQFRCEPAVSICMHEALFGCGDAESIDGARSPLHAQSLT